MTKILITGAGGYIGSVATYLFLQKGYEVVALDNFYRGYHQPLELMQQTFGQDKLHIYDTDLRDDLSPIFEKEHGIQAVVHYAALCLVNESMQKPEDYFSNNVAGSNNLLSTMTTYGVNNLAFSSTCAVYGKTGNEAVTEDHATIPLSPYGESKRMVEKMIEWYGQLKNMNYIIFRYFNICGASDDSVIGDSKKPSQLLVQNAVRGALGIEPFFLTCPEMNTPDKTPIRDYVNVVDLNEAHVKGLEYLLNKGKSEIINLGTGRGNSVLEIVKAVEENTGKEIKLEKSTPREGEYPVAIASIEKAKSILHWEPTRSIKQSVETLVKWYSAHPHGWDK